MDKNLQPKDDQERKWGVAMHASAFAGILFPLALALGPLLVWMLKKHESAYLDEQGKKAINFQMTVLLLLFACGVLALLIRPLLGLLVMIGVGGLIFAVMAAVMVYREGDFEYPFYFRIIN